MTSGEFSHKFSLPPADLKRLIDKTQFAISSEETRYYLNGIFIHVAEVEGQPMLRAVATDGHRLARLELPAPEGAAGMPGVILPRKAVRRSPAPHRGRAGRGRGRTFRRTKCASPSARRC